MLIDFEGIARRLLTQTLLILTAVGSFGAFAAGDDPTPAAGAAEPHFDVWEYRVVGNTVLSAKQIESLLYPLLGKDKSRPDVESAKTALEKLYHDQGYATVFVDVPPQTVTDGIVRLRVTEGRLESTTITGARFFPERDVIAQLPAAAQGGVLQVSELQKELATVNTESPDRSVVPILKAGSAPGTVDLALQVNDHLPLHGSLEFNNQASLDTRPLRSIASLTYDDLFGRLDTISFQYQASPQAFDQVRVLAANYVSHTLDSGLQPSLIYINSNSNVAAVGTLGVLGIGSITGLRLAYQLPAEAPSVQSLTLGVDYKHFLNTINESATTSSNTPITYLNVSLTYSGLWRSDLRTTTFTVSANAGPRGVVNEANAFENDRYLGRANYFYLRSDLAVNFKLPENFVLRLRAAGQAAQEPLITNENFSIAGIDGVRGYLESEELGDKAIKGTVQLTSPGWRSDQRTFGDLFVFFDTGRTWVIDPLASQPTGVILGSYGAGFDLLPGEKFTGSLTWARTLAAAGSTLGATREGQNRVLFLLRGSF